MGYFLPGIFPNKHEIIFITEVHQLMKKNTTSWFVTGLGAAMTRVGSRVGGSLGAGIRGFGLAHIILGTLDMFRPSRRRN